MKTYKKIIILLIFIFLFLPFSGYTSYKDNKENIKFIEQEIKIILLQIQKLQKMINGLKEKIEETGDLEVTKNIKEEKPENKKETNPRDRMPKRLPIVSS